MTKRAPANILLIDDDMDDRELFQQALHGVSPHSVLECYDNCPDALADLNKGDIVLPHVIFMDLGMPRIDGYQCLGIIKQAPSLKEIPIVVLSSSVSVNDMDRLYDAGVAFFISKPPTFEKLKAVIDKMVNTPTMYETRSRESFYVNREG